MAEAKNAAAEWALYYFRTLVGSKRFSEIMECNISDVLFAGYYSTGPVWGAEFGMEHLLVLFVSDDEVLHRTNSFRDHEEAHVTGIAQIFLELVLVMMSSFPREKVLEEGLEEILAIDDTWELTQRVDFLLRLCRILAQWISAMTGRKFLEFGIPEPLEESNCSDV